MAYQKNWIEKNMGITRKTIDTYEEHGFIHPTKNPNNGKYREFSEEDLKTIWHVKFFVELGFSLEEIKDMMSNPDFDFYKSIEEKIEKMEAEKNRLEQLIGLAKFIKATGKFPSTPKEMGAMGFEDFLDYSCKILNVDADPQSKTLYNALQHMISKPNTEWNDEDIQQFFEKMLSKPKADWSEEDILPILETSTKIYIYWKELAALSHYEPSHPDVQAIVKKMYDFEKNSLFCEYSDRITPQWYGQSVLSYFSGGDIATLNKRNLGEKNCEFIVKAIEYFGNHAE